MLTLTDNAATIVRDIASTGNGAQAPGLRITTTATSATEATYAITTTNQPQPGDQVIEQDGATVYLDDTAAVTLDDKVLDAGLDEAGNIQFSLALQP